MVKNRFYISKHSGIQYIDYKDWPYYEYEFLLQDLEEYIKKENKQNEDVNNSYSDYNPNKMMSSMERSINKQMKMPSISMPKIPGI